MSSVETWSQTAASNNSAVPNGAPEGMQASGLNDVIRENMSALATFIRQLPWVKLSTGLTLVRNSATQFQLTGTDVTLIYSVGRRLREVGATTVYGVVATSVFSGGNTLVDVANDAAAAIPTSLTAVDVATDDANSTVALVPATRTVYIPASAMAPATTAGCAPLTAVEMTGANALKPEVYVLDFDGATAEHAKFDFAFPARWNRGTITAQFRYIVNAAVNTTVSWQLRAVAASDGDALTSDYGTAITVTDAYLNTANLMAVTAFTTAVTVSGTPADGDQVFFRVSRDPSTDTTSQDARLLGVTLVYTIDAMTDS